MVRLELGLKQELRNRKQLMVDKNVLILELQIQNLAQCHLVLLKIVRWVLGCQVLVKVHVEDPEKERAPVRK